MVAFVKVYLQVLLLCLRVCRYHIVDKLHILRDYLYFYIAWGELFINGVWPYSAPYASYIYGPLWILTVGVFGFLPIHAWKLALPLFFYIIAKISLSRTIR